MTDFLKTMDREALEAEGIQGFAYGYRDRVRFYELDALNHVNNVVYLRWFETIRVAYVQDYGFTSYSSPDDAQLVVRRVTADYFAPVLQNQEYVVCARTTLIKTSSFVMEYAVFVGEKKYASGEAVVICLTPDGSGRRTHTPETIRTVLNKDGAEKG